MSRDPQTAPSRAETLAPEDGVEERLASAPMEMTPGPSARVDATRGSALEPDASDASTEEDLDAEERIRRLVREELHNAFILGPMLRARLDAAPWCIDKVILEGDTLELRGWALPPDDGYHPATFCLNDVPFEEIRYPLARDDVGESFWYRDRARYNAFECRTTIGLDRVFGSGIASFSFADRRTLRPFVETQRLHLIDPRKDELPIPDAERRHRVHGNDSESSFRLQGSSAYVKLDQAIARVSRRRLRDFPRILDWGIGCARVSRYFAGASGCELVGADIDHDNVGWCRENLGFGEFHEIGLDPPMPFEAEQFDLLFGISVFTHLREPDQFEWLEELARVAKRGAHLLMSVQGNNMLVRAPVTVHQIRMLDQSGFLNLGRCTGMIETPDDLDYYVNVVHTHEYIRDRWSRYFEILDILPAYIGNMQDLVIMRRR